MFKWSVLNDSIKEHLADPPEPGGFLDISSREALKGQISGILYGISNSKGLGDLYSLGQIHQRWHSPFMNRLFFFALNDLRGQVEDSYIDLLIDVFAEAAYIAQDDRIHKEADLVRMIESGFEDIFPELTFVRREAIYENYRLDLLAEEPHSGRAVIFEAKMEAMDPSKQLVAYRELFEDPLLVGITEKRLPDRRQQEGIYYFTYHELNKRAVHNIQTKFSSNKKSLFYFPQKFDEDLKLLGGDT